MTKLIHIQITEEINVFKNKHTYAGRGPFVALPMRVFKGFGAKVFFCPTRDYSHFGPKQEGKALSIKTTLKLLKDDFFQAVIPMSIDWPSSLGIEPTFLKGYILSPTNQASMDIEINRASSSKTASSCGIKVPEHYTFSSLPEASNFIKQQKKALLSKIDYAVLTHQYIP